MKRKLVGVTVVCLVGLILLGGCGMFKKKKEALTKEQQDKIVQYIADNFEGVRKVEFEEVNKNKLEGTTFVNVKVNDSNYLSISVGNDILDENRYSPGWNPKSFKLKERMEKESAVDTSNIKVIDLNENKEE